jgi:hypothetical protein
MMRSTPCCARHLTGVPSLSSIAVLSSSTVAGFTRTVGRRLVWCVKVAYREVNRANLKFTNFKHNYKSWLALELNSSPKERAKNKSQANKADDTVICFTEVRFLQTYSALRWSQRSGLFQPFPSLKRSLRPSELLFSIKRDTKSPQVPPHNWCLLPWLQLSWNQERRKKKGNPSARAQMNTSISLSFLSCIKCYSSCMRCEG